MFPHTAQMWLFPLAKLIIWSKIQNYSPFLKMTISAIARSNAWLCGISPAGFVGSNPAGSMVLFLLWLLCVIRWRSLRVVDHLSRGYLPSVVCPLSVIAKPRKGTPCAGIGSKSYRNIYIYIYVCVCVNGRNFNFHY